MHYNKTIFSSQSSSVRPKNEQTETTVITWMLFLKLTFWDSTFLIYCWDLCGSKHFGVWWQY